LIPGCREGDRVSSCYPAYSVSFVLYSQSAGNYFFYTKAGSFKPCTLPPAEKIPLENEKVQGILQGLFDNQQDCRISQMTFGSVMDDQ
jgi:hypothetical protein